MEYSLIHSKILLNNKNYSYLKNLKVVSNNIIDNNNKVIYNIKSLPVEIKNYNLYNIKINNIYNNLNDPNLPSPFPDDLNNIKYNIIIYLEVIKKEFNNIIKKNLPVPYSSILLNTILKNKKKYLNNVNFDLLKFYKKNTEKNKTNYIKFNNINLNNKYKIFENRLINSLIKAISFSEYKNNQLRKYKNKYAELKNNLSILLKQLKKGKSDYKKAIILAIYKKKN